MTREQIIAGLQAGEALYQYSHGSRTEEAFMAGLVRAGRVRRELVEVRGRLAYRYTWRNYVRVRIVQVTWYGAIVVETMVEV